MLVKDNELDIPSQISDKYFVSDDVFKFYSIFQWHHRKGPDILLKSYWKTFKKNDNVILILKVNDLGIPGFSKKDIKDDINKIKSKLNLSYYSPIFVIDNILPKKYIRALHTSADCYVSPYRGEGWGMPICDAILHKNPVIITKYGGVSDYLDSNSAGIIRHKMTSVKNMGWSPNIYNKSQRWAEPSAQMTSYLMRDVYKNFNKYKKRADIANKIIKDLSIESFSNIIEEYICQIS
jgi:glycosyltransferase involved in cell wall biosynthesis